MRSQQFFANLEGLGVKRFGGTECKGNPRDARPISTRRAMHLVMRSSLATGGRSFLIRARQIEGLVHRTGRRHGVRVYRYANAGNHLHLIVKPKTRRGFQAFLRAVTGVIARITLKKERGPADGTQRPGLKFWDARPFTRILEWGREFRAVADYLLRNTLEAAGFGDFFPPRRKPPAQRKPR